MTRRYIVSLFQRLIKEAQECIGLVGYKLTPDKNGMLSLGDLMRQPWAFEIHFADNYMLPEKRTDGMHLIISRNDYKLIEYSSDPRERTRQTKTFDLPTDVARHCASAQILVATNISLFHDEEYKSLNSKESLEKLTRQVLLIQERKQTLMERLDRYLRSRKARLICWLIKTLSKSA